MLFLNSFCIRNDLDGYNIKYSCNSFGLVLIISVYGGTSTSKYGILKGLTEREEFTSLYYKCNNVSVQTCMTDALQASISS